jgi:NFU1 iron-sulfur cluster scaffold homolog, mitochondrial
MFIQTEETPNPESLKFIPGIEVSPEKSVNFKSEQDCYISLLAKNLFDIKYVTSVFFGKDFITVSKQKDKSWEVIKPEILLTITEHFSANLPVFNSQDAKAEKDEPEGDELTKQIKEIIEHKIRPALAQDGGDVVFHSFKNGIVKLALHGACSGCPRANITLKHGIENMLKHYVPEVISVESSNNTCCS